MDSESVSTPMYVFLSVLYAFTILAWATWIFLAVILRTPPRGKETDVHLPLGLLPLGELEKQDSIWKLLLSTSLFEYVIRTLHRDESVQQKLREYYRRRGPPACKDDTLGGTVEYLMPLFRSVTVKDLMFALGLRNDLEHAESKRMSISNPSCDPPIRLVDRAGNILLAALADVKHLLPHQTGRTDSDAWVGPDRAALHFASKVLIRVAGLLSVWWFASGALGRLDLVCFGVFAIFIVVLVLWYAFSGWVGTR